MVFLKLSQSHLNCGQNSTRCSHRGKS